MSWYLSGGAGNSDPNAALGGAMSSTVVSTAINGLFDDVSGAESAAGDTEYRCIYWKNTAGASRNNVKAYIVTQPTGDDSFQIGLDLAGKNGTADTIADESTAPDPAVTFVDAADYANGIVFGTMAANDSYAIWVKRTTPAGAAGSTSSWKIRARGEAA